MVAPAVAAASTANWLQRLDTIGRLLGLGGTLLGGSGDNGPSYEEAQKDQLRRYYVKVVGEYIRRISFLNPRLATKLMKDQQFKENFIETETFWNEIAGMPAPPPPDVIETIREIIHNPHIGETPRHYEAPSQPSLPPPSGGQDSTALPPPPSDPNQDVNNERGR